MPRAKTLAERKRYHIWLDREDAEWIEMIFGQTVGFSGAIRVIVKGYRKRIEGVAAHRAKRVEGDVNMEEIRDEQAGD